MSGGVRLPYRNHLPTVSPDAFVAANATLIGQVEIGARANIWFGCVLRADLAAIHVGALTNVQDGTVVHVSSVRNGDTWIGERVTIGHMALIHACRLEDHSFVGMKACVMDGAVVETGAWIAAGAVVTPGKARQIRRALGRHPRALPSPCDRGGDALHRNVARALRRAGGAVSVTTPLAE